MVYGIFRYDGQIIGLDHLRNAVVDLRIQMVRPAYQQDDGQVLFPGFLKDLRAFLAHVFPVMLQFFIARFHGFFQFALLNVLVFKGFGKTQQHLAGVVDGQEGLHELDVLVPQHVHVVADIFRIRSHHRAIVVVAGMVYLVFHVIGHAGVEDFLYTLFHQVHDMPVDQLGRIAQGIGRNGGHAFVVDHGGGFARKHHFIP